MATAQNIVTGVAALITSTLANHKELTFVNDIQKNKLLGGTKGYGVTPAELSQTDGVTGYVTVIQVFEVVLTDSYGQDKLSDEAQRTAALTLFDRMDTLYRQIVKQKAGVPSVVRVGGLAIARPEFLDSNVAVLRATMNIQYRTAL